MICRHGATLLIKKLRLNLPWPIGSLAILIVTLIWPCSGQNVVKGHIEIVAAKNPRRTVSRYLPKSARITKTNPSKTAVVWLQPKIATTPHSGDRQQKEIKQRHLQFSPNVMALQIGETVSFPNQDDEYHNVLSYSLAKEFDLGRYLKSETPPKIQFDQAGVIEINCEIHEHMRGYIVVVDTPYYLTTSDGQFQFENVPAGQYTLHAWTGPRRQLQESITVQKGKPTIIDLGKRP